MNLSELISETGVFTNFQAIDKSMALEKLCRLAADVSGVDFASIHNVVWERELSGSTGVGLGVALPHGKINSLEKPFVILARAEQGVEFDSIDGLPVTIFVLIVTPDNPSFQGHLKILVRLGRIFQSRENVAAIMAAANEKDIYALLMARDLP